MLPDPFNAPYDGNLSIVTCPFTILTINGASSVRGYSAGALTFPNIMRTSHTVVGKGVSARDRHLLRLEANGVTDGVRDPNIVGSLYAVADIPRTGAFSATSKEELFRQFIGILRGNSTWNAASVPVQSTFFNRWLNGEV